MFEGAGLLSPLPAGPGRVQHDSRPTLLLIDDDSMVGRFIGHAAEECGYRARRVASAESFHDAFRVDRPDAVTVDLWVPGHDGTEIIAFLAAEGFEGVVIIISGLERRILDGALRFGQALGLRMAEPMAKPFLVDDLAARLAEPAVRSLS